MTEVNKNRGGRRKNEKKNEETANEKRMNKDDEIVSKNGGK